jgi:type IV pilus assembly protein PilV
MLRTSYHQGFSLLEVMVALVVLSVGLLGVVKLESVAYSSTTIASKRSLAALEASSMAASMHVNRGYWSSPDVSGAVITVTNGAAAVTASAPLLATGIGTATPCTSTSTPCAPVNMAAYDLAQWALTLKNLLLNQNAIATVTCGTSTPLSCMINITWTENTVATNDQETGALDKPSYTLYVQP